MSGGGNPRFHESSAIVDFGLFPQAPSRLFRRQVALGFAQHFVADHELFDGGGT